MRTFSTYIEYLLMTRHYCYVPGRGAYMLVDEPAVQGDVPTVGSDSRRLHDMKAPHRIVRFSPLHAHDDGLLANLLMEAEGMTYDEACRYIERQAPLLTDNFVQSASLHTDTDNFGFENLHVEAWTDIEARLLFIENAKKAGNTSDTTIPMSRRNDDTISIPKYWLKRVAVVFLIGTFFFTNFIGLNEGSGHKASVLDINAIQRNSLITKSSDTDEELAEQNAFSPTDEKLIESVIAEVMDEAVQERHPELVATVPVSPADIYLDTTEDAIRALPLGTTYFIIVGSTHSEEIANKIFNRYHQNGYGNVGILVTKGLYRVFIAQYVDKDEALACLRNFRNANDNLGKSWMLPFENDGSLSPYIIKNIYNDNQLSMELSHPYQRTERDQG